MAAAKDVFLVTLQGGLGGAGGLSDGKLNLRPDIGGNLEEFVSNEEAWSIINEIDQVFLKHGASEELYAPDEQINISFTKGGSCIRNKIYTHSTKAHGL
jgi:uncharacterized FAD-dependent dehydrogenase